MEERLLHALFVGLLALCWYVDRRWRARGTPHATTLSPARSLIANLVALLGAIAGPIMATYVTLTFVAQPFYINSASMVPTLLDGDLVLVNKVPAISRLLGKTDWLRRGDVIVFRYPLDPRQQFVKRVIGLPGEKVQYSIDRGLTIDGRPVPLQSAPRYRFYETGLDYPRYIEDLDGVRHEIITYNGDHRPPYLLRSLAHNGVGACTYSRREVTCRVPAGSYFVIGDNRDRSEDSRFWGFVAEGLVTGKALLVLTSIRDVSRTGSLP